MTNSQAISMVLVALFSGSLGTVFKGYFDRPRTKSDSEATEMSASVSLSAEVRKWVGIFEERTNRAESRADMAEQKAEASDGRLDHLESLMVKVFLYVQSLQQEVTRLGGTPPSPPPELDEYWK